MNPGVERHETAEGARIYRIPMQLFPELEGFAHLIITPAFVALYDVGSGFGDAGEQLDAGLRQVRDQFGEHVDWEDISCVLLSHGHIDHFGGLPFVRSRCQAPVYIHALDRRVLTRYEERLALVARRLRAFLTEAGVPGEEEQDLDMTLELMLRLTDENRLARTSPLYNYIPLPGTELWDLLVRDHGFEPPSSLEEWARVDYANVNVGHLPASMADRLSRGYFPTLLLDRKFHEYGAPWWVRLLADAYRPVARARVRRRAFGFQPEMLVARLLRSRWTT